MAPTGDWDRDEVFERIPWEHLSRDFRRFELSPRMWVTGGVGLVLVVAAFLLVGKPEPVVAEEVRAVVTVAPTVPPPISVPEVVAVPLSEADLFTSPPGKGELLAMTLAKTHVRFLLSSDTIYVDWVEPFGISSEPSGFSVGLLVGVLHVRDGAYEQLAPVAIQVGVWEDQILWSTPTSAPVASAPDRGPGGAEASAEMLAELTEAAAIWGELIEVIDTGVIDGALWGLLEIRTLEGAILSVEVWPRG